MLLVLAICIGASLGALMRWALAVQFGAGSFMQWGTLAANLIGGYLIGIAVAGLALRPEIDPVWRLAIVTGFLGALTTFSSFSIEVVSQLMEGRLGLAALTATAHLAGSLMLTWLGIRTVQLSTS
ncbi:MAG: fluoride efflux transporter CrcB [Variovorax sp.]